MLRHLICLLLLCFVFSSQAQEIWSLEKCIQKAQENSIDAQQALIGVKQSELTEKQNKLSRLPNLNASSTGQYNFGRNIDFTTNTFRTESAFFNSWSLSTNIPLYTGGAIHNSVKQSQFDREAAEADSRDINNMISLSVARAYLQILFAEEQFINGQNRLLQNQQQLNQTERLIEAGVRPANDRLDLEAQIARSEQSLISLENDVQIAYLNLKQLMQLPLEMDIRIERPDILIQEDAFPENSSLEQVYTAALSSQPSIKAGELRMRSAELGVDIAKANMLPTLTAFGSLSSNFSSEGLDFTKPDRSDVQLIPTPEQPVIINGTDAQFSFIQEVGEKFPKAGYFTQLDDNFGQGFGLSLSIPIYNRGRNSILVERARLDIINTELSNKRVKQQLKADIQRAIADAQTGKKAYEANVKTVNSLRIAYENAEKRFNLGVINSFELTTAKNNLDQAEVDLIVAKYDYLFKLKIVDFYEGRVITLD